MWRINLLHLPAAIVQLTVSIALVSLLTQCQIIPDEEVQPALTLRKGMKFSDPVVQTDPMPVTLIEVNNRSDVLLASSDYRAQIRPDAIINYGQYQSLVEVISSQKLMDHEFTWKSTGEKIVMVAIFRNVIRVGKNEIFNKEDLVWLWTNTRGTTDPGRAKYSDGKKADWDKTTNNYALSLATPLPSGKQPYYVWCVLVWDRQGYAIRQASRELPLFISG